MFQQTATKLMVRFGVTPSLPSVAGDLLPQSLKSGNTTINPLGNMMNLAATGSISPVADISKIEIPSSSYESHTQKVINNFLQSPLLESETSEAKSQVCMWLLLSL